ncbi:MAG: DUF559 domain-containing protein [Pseudomonadota bacterium]
MSSISTGQKQFARKLRQKDNSAEAILWEELRDRRLHRYKFVREHPVGIYFADFACRRKKLIVEIDGSQHVDSVSDFKRDEWLNRNGWSVLRFNNMLVLKERQTVLKTIVEVIEGRLYRKTESNEWRYWPVTGPKS